MTSKLAEFIEYVSWYQTLDGRKWNYHLAPDEIEADSII